MQSQVLLSKLAKKQLERLPRHIVINFQSWIDDVETNGIVEARKRPGYHDEPLRGDRLGQRSVRLSRGYRVIYEVQHDKVQIVLVIEVNKHEY